MLSTPKIDASHMPHEPGVYRLLCKPTGGSYVGGTANLRTRSMGHASQLARAAHYAKKMQDAYLKYGHTNFAIEVLEKCNRKELAKHESEWIEKLKPEFNTLPRRVRKPRVSKGIHPLTKKRLDMALTRDEFAQRLGVNIGTVLRWEHGHRPTPRLMRALADFLNQTTVDTNAMFSNQAVTAK